jgi:AN1-like Zinc finger
VSIVPQLLSIITAHAIGSFSNWFWSNQLTLHHLSVFFSTTEGAEEESAVVKAVAAAPAGDEPESSAPAVQTNRKRCFGCAKKVGLTGMECKCGYVFCSKHRYPEEHACSFDFRTQGREQLAKTVIGGGAFSKIETI